MVAACGGCALLVEAFARAVAGRTDQQLQLDPGNRGELAPWAPTSAACFGVFVTGPAGCRTLALDFDARGVFPGQPEHDARGAAYLLAGAGLAAVLVSSGGEGCYHVLATLAEPVPFSHVERLVAELRRRYSSLDAARRVIRPPGALHRGGQVRAELVDLTPTAALRILQAGSPASAVDELADVLGLRLLSAAMATMVETGRAPRLYATRSEALRALLVAYANLDAGADEVLDAVHAMPGSVGDKARELGPAGITRLYRTAMIWAAAHPPVRSTEEAQRRLDEVAQAAAQQLARGRAGATSAAVFQAHLHTARVAGLEYDLSLRSVAMLAGLSAPTVVAAQARLVADGWLVKVGHPPRGTTRAQRWRIGNARYFDHTQTPQEGTIGMVKGRTETATADADCWRDRGGLGKAGFAVWALLRERTEWHVDDLATRRGVQTRAVAKRLAALADHGLAERVRRAVWRAGDADPALVVCAAAAARTGRRQRIRFELDRAAQREWCATARRRQVHRRVERQAEPDSRRRHDPGLPPPLLQLVGDEQRAPRSGGEPIRDLTDRQAVGL